MLTSFNLEAGLKKYQSSIRRAKSAAVRDEGERLLEALRRALDKADGLDVIFQKHITNTVGKYLVFCANIEHLKEMMSHVQEWFGKIDPNTHVYYAYSDDPSASRAFLDFKADKSEEHLKLLFTVDMLNEGIHVDDVSGVILFRPTVSPIIYKQQIGRALSASGVREPVIIDVVNNIENLYSIGVVEQEMRNAMYLLHDRGDGNEITVDHFDVIDELLDCRKLFAKQDETLAASWDMMFACAKAYQKEHGNLLVERRYNTPEGYSIGNWIFTQRKVRAGKQYGNLDDHRIALLDSIGMVWDDVRELSWKQYYEALCRYKAQYGNIDIRVGYVNEDGVKLGMFIENLRSSRRDGRRTGFLTKERIDELDALGMIWDRLDYAWEQNYQACAQYYREHGDLNIPHTYTVNGLRIGTWVRRQRQLRDQRIEGVITSERIKRLDDIGMVWENHFISCWNYGYEQARLWYEQHGNLNVTATYVDDSGFALGKWLKRHIPGENSKTSIQVTPERRKKLDAIGMVWDSPEDSWEVRFALVKAYFEQHGDLNIPAEYKADGIWISKWLNEQRQIYLGKRPGKQLTEDQIRRLEVLGKVWENRNHNRWNQAWQEQFEEAKQFYQERGHLRIPRDYMTENGRNLGAWILRQRKLNRDGKLSPDQVGKLNAIDMEWELEDAWEIGYAHARQYYEKHHNLDVRKDFVCEVGFNLSVWLTNQRSNYRKPSKYHHLLPEQVKRLEDIGIVWNPREERWMEGYRHAEAYLSELNGKPYKIKYVSEDGFHTGEWIYEQLKAFRQGKMNTERMKLLLKLGLILSEQPRVRKQDFNANPLSKQGDHLNAAL